MVETYGEVNRKATTYPDEQVIGEICCFIVGAVTRKDYIKDGKLNQKSKRSNISARRLTMKKPGMGRRVN